MTAAGGTGSCKGLAGCGTVYELSAPGGKVTETVLYSFQGNDGGSDGAQPAGDLVFDTDGNLYGVTVGGGGNNPNCLSGCGTVFELSPPAQEGDPWTESVLYRFTFGEDGGLPGAGLVPDSAGNLYGTTQNGGLGLGVVFELSPPALQGDPWTETVLHAFQGGSDGRIPPQQPGFRQAGKSLRYDESRRRSRAMQHISIAARFSRCRHLAVPGGAWTETVIHAFNGADGAFPQSGLVIGDSGALAGTTPGGGRNSFGVAFGLQPPSQPGGAWKFSVLYSFPGYANDGASPIAGLTMGANNTLFGATSNGGTFNQGAIFKLQFFDCCGWREVAPLYSFSGGPGGGIPTQRVTLLKGKLYGTTSSGGYKQNRGIAFQLKP